MPIKSKAERAEYDKKYRIKNKERKSAREAQWRLDNAEHLAQRGAKRRLEKRAMCLIAGARTRSRNKGIRFELDGFAGDLQCRIDRGICELSGVKFDLSPGRKATSPSLDRINPKLGYVPCNVRVICHALNAALGDWGEDALLPIMTGWMDHGNAINAEAATIFIQSVMELLNSSAGREFAA
jgi:hypothetical protein